jgi:hypothetical protein
VKIQSAVISSFVAIMAVLGSGMGSFEYLINLKANSLPKSITEGRLTKVTEADIQQIDSLAALLNRSPLPRHQREAQRYNDLVEVAIAARDSFSDQKVGQLQVGKLLTLQQEVEDYIQRYPGQPFAAELKEELPSVRAMVTFFPVIKASAAERSVDSAMRASRLGATLAALVIRKTPDVISDGPLVAELPAAPSFSWSKAENDVLFDYSQALQPAERQRLADSARLEISRQVCSWLDGGQSYLGIRSMFDSQYKGTIAGDYFHNRDVYIRYSTERLCPGQMASLTPPAAASAPVAKASRKVVASQPSAPISQPISQPAVPQWTPDMQPYPISPAPVPPGMVPVGGFPGIIR